MRSVNTRRGQLWYRQRKRRTRRRICTVSARGDPGGAGRSCCVFLYKFRVSVRFLPSTQDALGGASFPAAC